MGLVAKAFQDIITFSRATQTGTYVNSSGYITNSSVLNYLTYSNQPENAAWTKSNSFVQQNLALYSQEADNATWTKANLSCTGANINAIVAPDGTLTADKVVETTTTAATHEIYQTISASATTYTVSRYFKAAERTNVGLYFVTAGTTAGAKSVANLSAGTVTVTNFGATTGSTSTITNVGDGWYRVTLTVLATATTYYFVALTSLGGTENFAGTIGFGFYTWGAQLVQGSVPGDYRATTSAALPCLYADYNGALRARKLCEDAANAQHYWSIPTAVTAGFPYTISFRAKAAEKTQIVYTWSTAGAAFNPGAATFNLSAGTVTPSGAATGTITSLGNGYFLCTTTATCVTTNASSANYWSFTGLTTYTGDGSSGIYIADAQLNDGSSALAYYDTTASAYNAPRFDYDPVTLAAKGLLVEEQRTNLLTYSAQFDNAAWTKTRSSITADNTLSPDGNVNADKLVEDGTAGATHPISEAVTLTAAAQTASCYVKASGRTWAQLSFTGTANAFANFNIGTGALGTIGAAATATITSVGNGWYRCTVTATTAAGANTFAIYPATADNVISYNGDSTSGLFLYGAQVEAGTFATSYIPTVASQVTRAADVASVNTLSPWYNSVAGTLYSEYDAYAPISGAAFGVAVLNDGTASNRAYLFLGGGTAAPSFVVTSAGVAQASINNSAISANTTAKTAGAYAVNDFAIATNAGTVATDASGALPVGLSKLDLGGFLSGTFLNGHLRRITYYPRRLTNAELQTLTTL
jgi:hypothetical protein